MSVGCYHFNLVIDYICSVCCYLGFSIDQFNRDDPNLGNRVILYNDQYSIPCQVVTYYTSTTKIVCKTG